MRGAGFGRLSDCRHPAGTPVRVREVTNMEEELERARIEAAQAKGEAANLRERLSTYERAVKAQAKRVDRLGLDLAACRDARDAMRRDLDEMEAALSEANRVLTEAHQRVERVRADLAHPLQLVRDALLELVEYEDHGAAATALEAARDALTRIVEGQ